MPPRRTCTHSRATRDASRRLANTARYLRIQGGWTLEEVAERASLDPRHVQLVESAEGNPTLGTLVRLAKGLETTVEALLSDLAGTASLGAPPDARYGTSDVTASLACPHRVRVARLSRGLSQAELAAAVGMSIGAIQGLERGKKSPTVRTLDAVASALGVQAWTLLLPDPSFGAPSRTRVSRSRPTA